MLDLKSLYYTALKDHRINYYATGKPQHSAQVGDCLVCWHYRLSVAVVRIYKDQSLVMQGEV